MVGPANEDTGVGSEIEHRRSVGHVGRCSDQQVAMHESFTAWTLPEGALWSLRSPISRAPVPAIASTAPITLAMLRSTAMSVSGLGARIDRPVDDGPDQLHRCSQCPMWRWGRPRRDRPFLIDPHAEEVLDQYEQTHRPRGRARNFVWHTPSRPYRPGSAVRASGGLGISVSIEVDGLIGARAGLTAPVRSGSGSSLPERR